MAHQSDNSKRLSVRTIELSKVIELPAPNPLHPEVFLFILPFGRSANDAEDSKNWFERLQVFARRLNEQSVVAVLTSAPDAAETWPRLSSVLRLQLWVAVKLDTPIEYENGQLAQHHAALLIMSKYHSSLKHTKTRVAYSYCPICDKTTKDYGGKKHTYHEYGTLVSDVWRDIAYAPETFPEEIVNRLADLFGLPPYQEIRIFDLQKIRALQSHALDFPSGKKRRNPMQIYLPSALINGDSLDELTKIPENSVDFCFADPPYNLEKRYDSWDDGIDIRDYFSWCDNWLDELARVLRPGCTCAVLNIPIWAIRHFQHLKTDLQYQAWIAWEGLGLPVKMIMPAHYSIVCFSKGVPRPLPGLMRDAGFESKHTTALKEDICVRQTCLQVRRAKGIQDRQPVTDLWWDIHRLKHNSRRVDHPCQLPPALMMRLIELFTRDGELVLDPFNGAGTTTLCAQILGRRYMGLELSPNYHELALSRHRLLDKGGDPFGKVNSIPKAKNSRVKRVGAMKYEVSKKQLQLDVKRIAKKLGRLPSRDDVAKHSHFPVAYYDEYFISWGEVCAAARTTGMTETRKKQETADHGDQPLLFSADS